NETAEGPEGQQRRPLGPLVEELKAPSANERTAPVDSAEQPPKVDIPAVASRPSVDAAAAGGSVAEQGRPEVSVPRSQATQSQPVDGTGSKVTDIGAKAVTSPQSAQNQGEAGSSGDQAGRDLNRQDSFRQSLEAIRAELGAQGKTIDGEKSAFGSGFSASLSGSAQNAEASNRLPPGLSSFQQLQYAYKGDVGNQVSLNLPERFGSDRWSPGLSQRLVWMSNQQIGRAELRLDPPDLGSLNIRLSIHNDQASLSFTSPHAQVRDVLEQQMPRLREMLAENGIELQHSDVSDQSPSKQSEQQGEAQSGSALSMSATESEESGESSPLSQTGSLALVDYYA
ncbi:MAG: flagellar hook-length control protein FliK, partial [Motiliproteus sp.]|nr:flagellar hook-length control protein FliK [Motiliproteus sp.]